MKVKIIILGLILTFSMSFINCKESDSEYYQNETNFENEQNEIEVKDIDKPNRIKVKKIKIIDTEPLINVRFFIIEVDSVKYLVQDQRGIVQLSKDNKSENIKVKEIKTVDTGPLKEARFFIIEVGSVEYFAQQYGGIVQLSK